VTVAVALASVVASGATYVVTSASDAGSGSLRQAILDANATPGPDEIRFPTTVPPFTVELVSPLPAIEEKVSIVSTPDQVKLDGRKLASGSGIVVLADNSVVDGVVLFGFPGHGIEVRGAASVMVSRNCIGRTYRSSPATPDVIALGGSGIVLSGASHCTVSENRVEGAADGIVLAGGGEHNVYGNTIGVAHGNRGRGIVVDDSSSNFIGAYECVVLCATSGNEVASQGSVGILVHGDSNSIVGNYVGEFDWGSGSGNGSHGIVVGGAANLVEANRLKGNRGDAIRVTGGSTVITGNEFSDNAGLPIDLAGDGPTPNDQLDADEGPDGFQNYPVLSEVVSNGYSTRFRGTLLSTPDAEHRIEFRGVSTCFGAAGGPAWPQGLVKATTDGRGLAEFDAVFLGAVPPGGAIAATATGAAGTSELGPCTLVSSSSETRADLSLRQTPSLATLTPGARFTIDAELSNAGPAPSGFVVMRNLPPTGARIVGASTTGGACYLGGLHECYLSGLPPGGSVHVMLELEVTANTGQSVTNTASAINGGREPDPVPGNDASTLVLGVVAPTRMRPARR
jgi:parallel beta-helix repeat protein